MKVVIAGAGNVGVFIAEDLCQAGHSVTMIEQEPAVVAKCNEEIAPQWKVEWVLGDACELPTLHRARALEADVVVAATGDDEDNLVVSLLAKQELCVPRVVARINHPKNEWLFNLGWGVDVAVSTPHLLSALVQEAVSVGSLVRLLRFETSDARLVEVTLAEDSPAAGVGVADLGLPRDATLVAVVRDSHVVVPRGDTVLAAGDEVLALVTADSEGNVRSLLISGRPQGPPRA